MNVMQGEQDVQQSFPYVGVAEPLPALPLDRVAQSTYTACVFQLLLAKLQVCNIQLPARSERRPDSAHSMTMCSMSSSTKESRYLARCRRDARRMHARRLGSGVGGEDWGRGLRGMIGVGGRGRTG